MSLATPTTIRTLQRGLYRKAAGAPDERLDSDEAADRLVFGRTALSLVGIDALRTWLLCGVTIPIGPAANRLVML